MPLKLIENSGVEFLEVHVTGKIVKEDYADFVPVVDRLVQLRGKIRVLMEMHDFHGWTAGAAWEDIKFDAKHFNHLERVAIVGEAKWQQIMAAFFKPFTNAKVRYFDRAAAPEARAWLEAP